MSKYTVIAEGYGNLKDSTGKTWITSVPEVAIEEAKRMNSENPRCSYVARSLDGSKI